jgi:hypothetical protein
LRCGAGGNSMAFGDRLSRDAKGFSASAMATEHAGD